MLSPKYPFEVARSHSTEPMPFAAKRDIQAHRLQSIERNQPGRAGIESFVRTIYAKRYGADVRDFAPFMVALRDETGTTIAAAGYRPAAYGPLFLERYLAAPVEALLARDAGERADRASIVEVGHLAASRAGVGRVLMELLGLQLSAQGFRWVVGTLTAELRHLVVRLGIVPQALGVADPSALGADAARWGRYYDHRPVVLAGRIDTSLQELAKHSVRS